MFSSACVGCGGKKKSAQLKYCFYAQCGADDSHLLAAEKTFVNYIKFLHGGPKLTHPG